MKITVNSAQDLVNAMGDELYGYKPAEKFNATEFKYPVTFETDEDTKTFKLYKEAKITEIPSTSETASDKKCPLKCKICIGTFILAALVLILIAVL